ncbi:MAG: hypothetical protein Q7S68_02830, partial [Deltaproteobacteria bacterium]|nr:hypothetical protein [Deltaproteobacteria bacterium]
GASSSSGKGKIIAQALGIIGAAIATGKKVIAGFQTEVDKTKNQEPAVATSVPYSPSKYIVRICEREGVFERLGYDNVIALFASAANNDNEAVATALTAMGYDPAVCLALIPNTSNLNQPDVILNILRLPPEYTPAFTKIRASNEVHPYLFYDYVVDVYKTAKAVKKEITVEQLVSVARDWRTKDVEIAEHNTLGAVTKAMAYEALVNCTELLAVAFGIDADNLNDKNVERTWKLNDKYQVKLQRGKYEAACGLELALYRTDEVVPRLIGTIGFQMSDSAIEVVRFQGAKLNPENKEQVLQEFRELSGGVDPLPWLAFVTGRVLLNASKKSQKQLRFIDGEWVVFCYPHVGSVKTPGLDSITEAKAYPWKSDPPPAWLAEQQSELSSLREMLQALEARRAKREAEGSSPSSKLEDTIEEFGLKIGRIERAVAMHKEGPTTIAHYHAMAENLGFRKWGQHPWRRYTKSPADFGKQVISKAADPKKFEESVAGVLASIKGESNLSADANEDQDGHQQNSGNEPGNSSGNPTASNGHNIFGEGPMDNAAARATEEPANPLQKRGLFATNGDDGEVSGGEGKTLPPKVTPFNLTTEKYAGDQYGDWDDMLGHKIGVAGKPYREGELTGPFHANSWDYGFSILHNASGQISAGGFVFCTRVTMVDPVHRIAVDSHLPVDNSDLAIFEKDLDRLLAHLVSLGMDLDHSIVRVVYGDEDQEEGPDAPGLKIAALLREKGLKVDSVLVVDNSDRLTTLDLTTGEIKLEDEPGNSSGNPTASNGHNIFGEGPMDNAAARATEEPANPLQKRGLFATNGDDGEVSGGAPSPRAIKERVLSELKDWRRRVRIRSKVEELGGRLHFYQEGEMILAGGEAIAMWDGTVYVPYDANNLERNAEALAEEIGHALQREEGLLELNPDDYPGLPARLTKSGYDTDEKVRVVYEADAKIFAKRALGQTVSDAEIDEIFRETQRVYGDDASSQTAANSAAATAANQTVKSAQTFAAPDHRSWPAKALGGIADTVLAFLHGGDETGGSSGGNSTATNDPGSLLTDGNLIDNAAARAAQDVTFDPQKKRGTYATNGGDNQVSGGNGSSRLPLSAEQQALIDPAFLPFLEKLSPQQQTDFVNQIDVVAKSSGLSKDSALDEKRRATLHMIAAVINSAKTIVTMFGAMQERGALSPKMQEKLNAAKAMLDFCVAYFKRLFVTNEISGTQIATLYLDGEIFGDIEGLVQTVWNSTEVKNIPHDGSTNAMTTTERIPKTKAMCQAMIASIMKERGYTKPEQVQVYVMGFGPVAAEIIIWLELGATVVAVDPFPDAHHKLQRDLRSNKIPQEDQQRLQVLNHLPQDLRGKGDIVTWSHPKLRSPFLESSPYKTFLAPLKEAGGIFIMQSDPGAESPQPFLDDAKSGRFAVLLDTSVNEGNYFFPSVHLHHITSSHLIILQRPKAAQLAVEGGASSGGHGTVTNGPTPLFIDSAFGGLDDAGTRGLPTNPALRGGATFITNGDDGQTAGGVQSDLTLFPKEFVAWLEADKAQKKFFKSLPPETLAKFKKDYADKELFVTQVYPDQSPAGLFHQWLFQYINTRFMAVQNVFELANDEESPSYQWNNPADQDLAKFNLKEVRTFNALTRAVAASPNYVGRMEELFELNVSWETMVARAVGAEKLLEDYLVSIGVLFGRGGGGRSEVGPYPLPANLRPMVDPDFLSLVENIPSNRQNNFTAAIQMPIRRGGLTEQSSSAIKRQETLIAVGQVIANVEYALAMALQIMPIKKLSDAKLEQLDRDVALLSQMRGELDQRHAKGKISATEMEILRLAGEGRASVDKNLQEANKILLKIKLQEVSDSSLQNKIYSSSQMDRTNADSIPRTKAMGQAMMQSIMRERGYTKPEEVQVFVMGYGPSLIESFLWLELGATVVAVDPDSTFQLLMKRRIEDFNAPQEQVNRLHILEALPENLHGKGDIVTWSHPSLSSVVRKLPGGKEIIIGPSKKTFFEPLKNDGVLIVQRDHGGSDISSIFKEVDAGNAEILFEDHAVTPANYFFPSGQLNAEAPATLVIVKREPAQNETPLRAVEGEAPSEAQHAQSYLQPAKKKSTTPNASLATTWDRFRAELQEAKGRLEQARKEAEQKIGMTREVATITEVFGGREPSELEN